MSVMSYNEKVSTRVFWSLVFMVYLSPARVYAEIWDTHEKTIGAAFAYEDKTTDPKFEGAKLFIDGRYYTYKWLSLPIS